MLQNSTNELSVWKTPVHHSSKNASESLSHMAHLADLWSLHVKVHSAHLVPAEEPARGRIEAVERVHGERVDEVKAWKRNN